MPVIRKNIEFPLLPDYPYQPNFIEIEGVRIHYIDEGNKDVPTILFLHGVPTWSYTFRNIFPICINKGYRVIAPDLPGFGKSDKPKWGKYYSIEKLVECTNKFICRLKLQNIVLFAHDWGAIIGMILAANHPEYFSGIVACNGLLPVPEQKVTALFYIWKWFARYSPVLPVGEIINFACNRKLSRAEKNGYNYPFSNKGDKKAIRFLPGLIPLKSGIEGYKIMEDSWKILKNWEKPFLTVFSSNDPITKGGEKIIQSIIPGSFGQMHQILKGKHFIQEDYPEKLGRIINDFMKSVI